LIFGIYICFGVFVTNVTFGTSEVSHCR